MNRLIAGGIELVVMYCGTCMLKQLLPEGSMRRSAKKALDIVTLLYLIKIISGVLTNG